jgi:hypothetical protein
MYSTLDVSHGQCADFIGALALKRLVSLRVSHRNSDARRSRDGAQRRFVLVSLKSETTLYRTFYSVASFLLYSWKKDQWPSGPTEKKMRGT